jgi:hypothetical protein
LQNLFGPHEHWRFGAIMDGKNSQVLIGSISLREVSAVQNLLHSHSREGENDEKVRLRQFHASRVARERHGQPG